MHSKSTGPSTAGLFTETPSHGGNYITVSFADIGDEANKKHDTSHVAKPARRVKGLHLHARTTGYTVLSKATKHVTSLFLPTPGIDDRSGTDVDICAATTSNLDIHGQAVLVRTAELTGSTLRLVESSFAKQLPKDWAMAGKGFKRNNAKAAPIKDLLPNTAKAYAFLLCPNAWRIQPGAPRALRGAADQDLAELFKEDHGKPAAHWLMVIADLAT